MKIDKPDSIKINFILGSTRSGTTLLSNILNNHKDCVSSAEIKHLLLFYRKHHGMKEVSADLINDVEYYKSIMEQASDRSYANSSFKITLGEKINYFEFCKRIYFTSANHKNNLNEITTIVDKNPFYTLKADKLSAVLPDAKFLCTVRDYRSFFLSNIQSVEPYSKNTSIRTHSIVWMFYNKLVLDIKKKHQEKTLIVPYEKLISDKEKTFKEICIFFNIEYDVNCFDYQENINQGKEKFIDKRYTYKNNSLLRPINNDRLDAWKDVFSDFQLKIMDFWCGKTGEKLGYNTITQCNLIESIFILTTSLPYYIRAFIYFKLKSIKLNFYLNEGRKAKYYKGALHQ